MKRVYYLIFGLFLMSFISANAQKVAQAELTSNPLVIDGVIEEAWDGVTSYSIGHLVGGAVNDAADFSGRWRALWDIDNLYLLVEVNDDSLHNLGAGAGKFWIHDCAEVFFDMLNEKNDVETGTAADDDKYQYRFIYDLDDEPFAEGDPDVGVENVSASTASGYLIEIKFPWSTLVGSHAVGGIEPGLEIGLEWQLADLDQAEEPAGWSADANLTWNNPTGADLKNVSNFGTLQLSLPQTPVTTVSIMQTRVVPDIDGTIDAIWANTPKFQIANLVGGTRDNEADFSGTWSGLWDTDNLYLLVEVNDDALHNLGAGAGKFWIHDCAEVFFDMLNEKSDVETGAAADDDKYQYRFIYDLDDEPFAEGDPDVGVENVSASTASGYLIEIKFPWSTLVGSHAVGAIEAGLKIGMEWQLADLDQAEEPAGWSADANLTWNNPTGADLKNVSNFGTAVLKASDSKSVAIPKTDAALTIDGELDEFWMRVNQNEISNLYGGVVDDQEDLSANWRAAWDTDNLYMLVEVTDEALHNLGPGAGKFWIHDCVEVFFDMLNEKNDVETGDAADDDKYQYRFIYDLDDEPFAEGDPDTGIENVSKATDVGYNVEIKFPWATLVGSHAVGGIADGLNIGLEFQMADLDQAEEPAGWSADANMTWNNATGGNLKKASSFGTIVLKDEVVLTTTVNIGMADAEPVIDGRLEASWEDAPVNPIVNLLGGARDNEADFSGSWRAMWDTDNLYFMFEVTDEALHNLGAGASKFWIHDCVEVFFDMLNEKNDVETGTAPDDDKYQYRFIYGLDSEPFFEGDPADGIENVSLATAAGYNIEVKFPWKTLVDGHGVGDIIENLGVGLEIQLSDLDQAEEPDGWSADANLTWNNSIPGSGLKLSSNFGTIILKEELFLDTEAPTAPANLAGDFSDEDKTITLTWDAATDNEGVVSYNVYDDGNLVENVDALTLFLNLEPGTTFDFTVTAIDAAGNESGPSNVVTAITTGVTPLPEGSTIIGKTADAPVIDGDVDASWANANKYIVSPFGARPEAVTDADFSVTYSGMWDADNLYLLFEVTDDILLHNDYFANGNTGGFYVHDCVELFIGDEANLQQYHYRFIYNLDDEVNFDPVPAGYKNVSKSTDDGYNIEVSIPWASLANDSMSMPEIKRAAALNFWVQVTDLDRESENPGWFDISTHAVWPIGGGPGLLGLANANEVVFDTEAPAAPANVQAAAHPVLPVVELTWSASGSDDVLAYHVYQGDLLIASSLDLTAQVQGLDGNTEYTFTVLSVDAENKSGASNSASATTAVLPTPQFAKIGQTSLTGEDPFYEFDMGVKGGMLAEHRLLRRVAEGKNQNDQDDWYPTWSAVWNSDYLYVRVKVRDDAIFNGNDNTWQNDMAEFYFDMWNDNDVDNPGSTHPPDATYQDDNMQYRVIAMNNDLKSGSSQEYPDPCTDANCHPDQDVGVLNWTGVTFLSYVLGQNEGYFIDIQWPWSSLGCVFDGGCFVPEIGKTFGFDMVVSDFDEADADPGSDGNQSDNSAMWSTWSPSSILPQHRNNSEWGNIELAEMGPSGTESLSVGELAVYPNPARDIIYVSIPEGNSFDRIEMADLTGRKVLSQSIQHGSGDATVNVEHLSSGFYLISLHGNQRILKTTVVVD